MTLVDQSLAPVRDALIAGIYKVLSLDVFDTLVWRKVPEPEDVFLILGRQLTEVGQLRPHISPVGFAELRQQAQSVARERTQAATGSREVTLYDIYAEISDAIFADGFDTEARVQAELACESGQLILDEQIAELVRRAKKYDTKVILVSDTYFSADNIRSFLASAGFKYGDLIDHLYVSCEAGRPKYRDLFDVVLKELDIPAGQMLHVGDNQQADVSPCYARRIAFIHYEKWKFSPRVQDKEFPKDSSVRSALLGAGGDLGLTGLRSRIYRSQPAAMDIKLLPYWRYGAVVLAPIFAGFSRWAVSKCQEEGVTRIFGIMREGRFLGRVVEATAKTLGVDLAAEELWLSRRAVVRAALYPDDLSRLSEALALSAAGTQDEILASLGLVAADFEGISSALPDLRSPAGQAALRQAIMSVQTLRDKVTVKSAQLRRNLLKALSNQIDFNSSGQIVVMDLGYAGTIQSVLSRILQREGARVRLVGLYVALNEKALIHIRGGADLRGYLDHEGYAGETAALLSRTPDVLEHACMCPEGSLAAYDDNAVPILLPNQREPEQITQMETLQDGIVAGVAAINDLLGGFDKTPGETLLLKKQIAQIIRASLLYPTKDEAETIGSWRHEANFDLEDVRRLKDLSIDVNVLQYQGWPALQDLQRPHCYWPAAALVSVNPYIAAVYAAGVHKTYEADHLTSGPMLGGLTICPDVGIGFDARREGALALSVNAFGRGDVSATIKTLTPEIYRSLRLRFPKAHAVLTVDQIVLTYVGEQQRKTVALNKDAGFDRLRWANVSSGGHGAMFTAAAGGEVVIDLTDVAPPWVHALHFQVQFKYLLLGNVFG